MAVVFHSPECHAWKAHRKDSVKCPRVRAYTGWMGAQPAVQALHNALGARERTGPEDAYQRRAMNSALLRSPGIAANCEEGERSFLFYRKKVRVDPRSLRSFFLRVSEKPLKVQDPCISCEYPPQFSTSLVAHYLQTFGSRLKRECVTLTRPEPLWEKARELNNLKPEAQTQRIFT